MNLQSTLNVASALWQRDMLRFKKERSRWLGLISQPLMFWFLIGFGLNGVVAVSAGGSSYVQYFYSGSLVMCVLFTTLFGAISLIEDAQSGFLRAILASPAPRVGIALGKVAGLITLVLAQLSILLLFLPIAGLSYANVQWLTLVTGAVLGSAALAALNLGSALLINSVQGYHAVMGLLLFPLWIVSGSMFPIAEHGVLAWIAALNPMTHIATLFRCALLGEASTSSVAWHIAILSIEAFLCLCFTTAMTKSRKARHG